MKLLQRLAATHSSPAAILIRLMVGSVFMTEGLLKFLFPELLGSGRFAGLGLPQPELLAPFVGVVEIACGALVLLGLMTRAAVVPLIVVMLVAMATTKLSILQNDGIWKAAHELRTDWSMLLGSLFLLSQGAGPSSLDLRLFGGQTRRPLRSQQPLLRSRMV